MPYQFPNAASGGGLIEGNSESSGSSVMMRDANGDTKADVIRAQDGLRSAGHTYLDYQAETASFAIDEATENGTIYGMSASAGARTVTLPAASSLNDKIIIVKKTDSSVNAVTVDGNASETIDGLATFVLYTQGDTVALVCDGSNWHVLWAERNSPTIAKATTATGESQRVNITYLCTVATAWTFTLPSAASMNGITLTFVKVDAPAAILTLDGAASETINGATTNTEIDAQYDSLSIVSNGTAWFVVQRKIT